MPKHIYSKLRVTCSAPREFRINQLREAVEYLKTIPAAYELPKFIGLVAETRVSVGEFKLHATPMLSLAKITGKTPPEVWDLFDDDVDRQIAYFEQR